MQARSRERVERILDAAAEEFADAGFDAATTEAIARRAETSIGSVYQFFPNKQALFDAVAHRYLVRSRVLFDELFATETGDAPWPVLLDAVVDAFAAFLASEPGFRAVWVGSKLSRTFVAEGEKLTRDMAARTRDILRAKLPHADPKRIPLAATMVVEITSAMLITSARQDPKLGRRIIDETKVVLRRYLESL
jgi:AcrR family transcriptional regulator